MENEKNTVVFKDVIYLDGDLWRVIKKELIDNKDLADKTRLSNYPLYRRGRNGAVIKDDLLSYHARTILFFDVTHASEDVKEELCEKYHVEVSELPVPTKSVNQYLSLMPILSDEFKSLDKEERDLLGNDLAMVEYRDGGLRVTKCIMSPRGESIPGNVYLNVDFSKIPYELANKIEASICHMVLNDRGYYDKLEVGEETKEYNKK